jgi:long-chain fatty acid transport protein
MFTLSNLRLAARAVVFASAAIAAVAADRATAGGVILYEVGSADVGLASAGYTARAQDASTVFTNPAGMTRLDGNQLTLGAQLLYANLGFSIGESTSPGLGNGDGGNPVGWFPGGGMFYSYSVSPDLKLGFAATGNFGLAEKYDAGWVGRYYVQESTLIGMSFLPSIAYRVNDKLSLGASLNAMLGLLQQKVAVNNIIGPDGQLKVETHKWGWGANLGLLYEPDARTRFGVTYNSQVKLNFSGPAEWSGLAPGLESLLASRGLLNANIDMGMTVPQGVNASFYTAFDDRWALLGSAGWQQWSKFGKVDIGIDSNDPTALTANANYKDTWHGAIGAQYQMSAPWLLNFGVAYDSAFQGSTVPAALPANSAWRFGVGAQKAESKTFNWGVSAEYVYGGTLDVDSRSKAPVALGGRGDLVGSFNNAGMLFMAANLNWKF